MGGNSEIPMCGPFPSHAPRLKTSITRIPAGMGQGMEGGGCGDVVGVGDGNILPDDSVNKPRMETSAPYRAASWSFISSLDE